MSCNIHKLPLPGIPCLCTILLLICSGGSNPQNYFEAYTLDSRFMYDGYGFLFLANSSSSTRHTVSDASGGLGSYMKTDHPVFNLSDNGWFFIPTTIFLWNYKDNGTGLNEASFNFWFTVSINQTIANSSLVFAIHPSFVDYLGYPVSFPPNGTSDHSSNTVAGSHVSARISTVYGTASDPRYISLVQIDIESPGNSSVGSNYSVLVDYDHVEHLMSVSVDAVGVYRVPLLD